MCTQASGRDGYHSALPDRGEKVGAGAFRLSSRQAGSITRPWHKVQRDEETGLLLRTLVQGSRHDSIIALCSKNMVYMNIVP